MIGNVVFVVVNIRRRLIGGAAAGDGIIGLDELAGLLPFHPGPALGRNSPKKTLSIPALLPIILNFVIRDGGPLVIAMVRYFGRGWYDVQQQRRVFNLLPLLLGQDKRFQLIINETDRKGPGFLAVALELPFMVVVIHESIRHR